MSTNFKKLISFLISFCLILEQSVFAQAIDLSRYFVHNPAQAIQSDKFRPLHLRYLGYDNQGQDFKLLLDKGDTKKEDIDSPAYIEENTQTLLKYFFIGLALPNEKFWVNLRPDSPDNILDPDLEKTDIGRIFLEADVQLKKDTASFTSPQTPEGKVYWDKLYQKAGELFSSENITIPTLTRPWIVPNEIIIREAPDNAYSYKATLKVMLEEDYLKSPEHQGTSHQHNFIDPRLKELNEYSTQLIKELIIPKLTYQVNTAKRYAHLRQVYYSLILAQWFKQKFGRQSPVTGLRLPDENNPYLKLIDSKDLTNLTTKEPYYDKQTYFKQYQQSFKDGEYNLSEPIYTPYGQSIRKYMSGGMFFGKEVSSAIEEGRVNASQKSFFGKIFLPFFIAATVSYSSVTFGEPIRLHYNGEKGTEKSIPLSAGTRAEINVLKNALLDPDSRKKYPDDSKNNRKSMLNKLMVKIDNDKEKIEFLKEISRHSDLKAEVMALWHKSLGNLKNSSLGNLPDAGIELGLIDIEEEIKKFNEAVKNLYGDDLVEYLRGVKFDTGLFNGETINKWIEGSGEKILRHSEKGPGTGNGTKDMYDSILALVLAGRNQSEEINTDEGRKALQQNTKVWKYIKESGVSPDENPKDWLKNLKEKGIDKMNPAEIAMRNYLDFDVLNLNPNANMPSFGELLISATLNMDSEQRKKYIANQVSDGDSEAERKWVERLMNMPDSKERLWKDFSTALLLKLGKIIDGNIDLQNVLNVFLCPEFEGAAKGVLKEIIGEDEGGQLLGITLAVDWNLRNHSIEATDENIGKAVHLTVAALKSDLFDPNIFTEETFQAILVHSANSKNLRNASRQFKESAIRAGVPGIIEIENFSGLKQRLRIIFTDEINKSKRVLIFNAHGQRDSLGNEENESGEDLSVTDLAEVLSEYNEAGGDLSELTLLVRSCYSQDYAEGVLERLNELLIKRGREAVLPKRVFFFQ